MFVLTEKNWVEAIYLRNPSIMVVRTTQVQAVNMQMNHDNNLRNWMLVKDTRNALKLQIIQIFDEGYLLFLRHRMLGYKNVTPVYMMTNLKDTY